MRPSCVATGGTLFGNALSMAAARFVLTEVLTDAAYAHAAALGARLADGIEAVAAERGLRLACPPALQPLRLHARGRAAERTRTRPAPASTASCSTCSACYMANRGVWEAIDSAGPACGTETTEAGVDRYLEQLDAFLGSVGT